MSNPAISMRSVTHRFGRGRGSVTAVDTIDFDLGSGEVACLVGESGCGKTTAGRIMAGLLTPTEGTVWHNGVKLDQRRRRVKTRHLVQYIHQDPYSSLIPGVRVGRALEAAMAREPTFGVEARARDLLEAVGLDPDEVYRRYPNELSGGQRQRVSIARALTVDPMALIADEAVSMIDASLRVSILDTFHKLGTERGIAVLLITHDLGAASHLAREGRIGVMYLGRLVEVGPTDQLMANPQHPYSKALIDASLSATSVTSRYLAASLGTEIPDPSSIPSGCSFHPRCADRITGVCVSTTPALVAIGRSLVSCHAVRQETQPPEVETTRREK